MTCDNCRRANEAGVKTLDDGSTWRRGHSCMFRYGEDCDCQQCHPAGSFKITGTVQLTTSLEVDLAELIRDREEQYLALDLTGYEEWERPLVMLYQDLEEDSSPLYGPHVSQCDEMFDFRERHWGPEEFEALCQVCPEARVDPREATE